MPRLFYRICGSLLGTLSCGLAGCFSPPPSVGEFSPPLPLLSEEPLQANTAPTPVEPPSADWTLISVASYSLTALVMDTERYRFDALSALSPLDLAVAWGPVSTSRIQDSLAISQSGRWFHWHTAKPLLDRNTLSSHMANIHAVPANPAVRSLLLAVRRGDVVTLQGKLVNVLRNDGFHANTSLSRTDTGGGACEILYIEAAVIQPSA
jgi:hypothetical protein